MKRPTLGSVKLRHRQIHGRDGVPTTARISERGTLEAEYYRLRPRGGRRYDGYVTWKALAGVNRFDLGALAQHFKARPGQYAVILRATDLSNNVSKPIRRRFAIVG